MKRRNVLKGLFAGALAGPVLLKAKPVEKVQVIGLKRDLTGRPVIDGMKTPPREGDTRHLPLKALGMDGGDSLCGHEESPQTEVYRSGKWVPLS